MKRTNTGVIGTGWLCLWLLLSVTVSAQQRSPVPPQSDRAYSMSRETVLQGTVVQYTPASSVAPLGAHVTVQTGAGVTDVHLGNPRLLTASHLTLSSGDAVRIVGENLAYGQGVQFVARLLQKGNQVVELRSTRGFPLAPSAKFGERDGAGAL
jgi:hypothetical protein